MPRRPWDLLLEASQADPTGIAAIDTESREEVTYSELEHRARSVAARLEDDGVVNGDRIGVYGRNSIEWLTAFLGVNAAGAVTVGLSTWATPPELVSVIETCKLSGIVIAGLDPDAVQAHDPLAQVPRAWSLRGVRVLNHARPKSVPPPSRVPSPGLAAIIATSGSTGSPKAVMLSDSAVTVAARGIADAQGLAAGDRVWSHFPLFFSGGLCNFVLGALAARATIVLTPRFSPEHAVEALERHRCTALHAWSSAIERMVEHAGEGARPLRQLRKGTWPLDLWSPLAFPNFRGINLFGMTETCTVLTSTVPTDDDWSRGHTNGRPLPGCEVSVVDETGAPVPIGTAGIIRARGLTIMDGYWAQEDQPFDSEGWLLTNDTGHLDHEGRLVWSGRRDTMLRRSGIIVSPTEIEVTVAKMPGVADVLVLDCGEKSTGDNTMLAVIGVTRVGVTPATVSAWMRENLSSYKIPDRIHVCPESELPRLPTGKINRRALRSQLAGAHEADPQ